MAAPSRHRSWQVDDHFYITGQSTKYKRVSKNCMEDAGGVDGVVELWVLSKVYVAVDSNLNPGPKLNRYRSTGVQNCKTTGSNQQIWT